MKSREEIARELAKITGRPVSEFFNGTVQEEKKTDVKSSLVLHASETRGNIDQPASAQGEKTKESGTKEGNVEVLNFQKMFAGSKIVKGQIHNGRQMTKKEYIKYSKKLTMDELYKHPLHFKMFRAEGQNEVFYPRWLDNQSKGARDDWN